MRSRALLLATVLLAVVLTACEQAGSGGENAEGPIRVGEPAPNFSLPEAGGGEMSLADHEGSPVLLYFSMGPG